MLPAYAADPARSRGRVHAEPEDPVRSPFQRDRDRIVHCTAFRRLEHKTQVFVRYENDHYRSRLTHSLEVGQVARAVARSLDLDQDLSEAIALAHDLGHPPFAHAGEDALAEVMDPYNGFDHNAQALRVVTLLEQCYVSFDGLNLTWETLEGIAKHNGPVTGTLAFALRDYRDRSGPDHDLRYDSWPTLEAQVASMADDISYCVHDIEDGMRAGFFTLGDLAALRTPGSGGVVHVLRSILEKYPGAPTARHRHEFARGMMGVLITDLIRETRRRLTESRPESVDGVRANQGPLVGFSSAMEEHIGILKSFLMERFYRDYRVHRMNRKASRLVRELFDVLFEDPDSLPPHWRARLETPEDLVARARLVVDYVAGMADRFAVAEHQRLLDPYTDSHRRGVRR